MDLQNFLHMGGYAGYVWTAYGLTALVLLWNWWAARRSEAEAADAAHAPHDTCPGEPHMTPRQKRMVTVVAILAGVGIATAFALKAFNQNLLYYYSPTQIQAGEAPDAAARSASAAWSRTAA